MAATTVRRQPFGELGAARLQSLVSAKNRQNAVTEMLKAPSKDKHTLMKNLAPMNAPQKRAFEAPAIFEDESDPDTENMDPSFLSTKRGKTNDGGAYLKPAPHFTLTTLPKGPVSKKSTIPTATTSTTLATKYTPPPFTYPGGASTAPAGRSPQHKRIGLLSKQRSSSYKRVSPPSFGSATGGLPFSLDEAIRGSCSSGKTDRSKPKGWFFDIYEDTPDEEAATMMEHGACMLDLSSDDENVVGMGKSDGRDKENIPPPGHVEANPTAGHTGAEASLGRVVGKARRSVHVDVMVDEGEERAPLGVLAAEDFYAEGLDATSVEVITPEADAGEGLGEEENRDENRAPSVSPSMRKESVKSVPSFIIAEDEEEV